MPPPPSRMTRLRRTCARLVDPVLNPKLGGQPEFASDGCSLWPDLDYGQCCVEHDRAYWRGGAGPLRLEADLALMACVSRSHGWVMGWVMFAGVRCFGHWFWPTRYRWGYRHSWPTRPRRQAFGH